jgi:hypothetical protein
LPVLPTRETKINSVFLDLRTKNFLTLGVNFNESYDDVAFFLADYTIDYPLLDDRKHQLVKPLGIDAVDTKSFVPYIHRGFKNSDGPILDSKISAFKRLDL